MTLTETITAGMNNPECAFFVGEFTGRMGAVSTIMYVFLMFAVFKFLDKLAFDPFMNWIKKKLPWGKKE